METVTLLIYVTSSEPFRRKAARGNSTEWKRTIVASVYDDKNAGINAASLTGNIFKLRLFENMIFITEQNLKLK